MTRQPDSEGVDAGVKRVVGVATLRRLHRLVGAERAQDEANARAVPKVIAFVIAVAVLLAVVRWLLLGRVLS